MKYLKKFNEAFGTFAETPPLVSTNDTRHNDTITVGVHKYIVTDEKIQDGDIYYWAESNEISGCTNTDLIKQDDRKVVATNQEDNPWGLPVFDEFKTI